MSATVLKSGVLKLVGFEFRPINGNGDVIDPELCATLAEAMVYVRYAIGSHDGECVAWVVEKHTSYHPAHLASGEPDNYTTLAHGGDETALREGGWIAGGTK